MSILGKIEKKQVKFKLDEIPVNGCLIKEDYFICKDENGSVRVGKVEGPLKTSEIKKSAKSEN